MAELEMLENLASLFSCWTSGEKGVKTHPKLSPSTRSPLVAFVDFKVSGGDL